MTLAAGTRLGPYEISGPIGAGGMGEVYRARDTRLGREVAIKVLPDELTRDPQRLARFEREARSSSGLNHRNIVTIHDFTSSGDESWLVMELIKGESLRDLITRGPVPTKKLLTIASGIADGLAAAHAAGIVHRDLKPENVMITGDGTAKILDFGLVKQAVATDLTNSPTDMQVSRSGTILGTAAYMSPEQARGEEVDFHTDQFSLGLIVHEMATGKHPFRRPTAVETLAAILNDEPAPLSEPFAWIVERCLAKNPVDRYGSTADLAHDLRRLPSVRTDKSVGATQKSSWWPIAIGVAAILVAIAIATVRRTEKPGDPYQVAVPTPEIAQIAQNEVAQPVALSPDGHALAIYGMNADGIPALWVHDLRSGAVRQVAENVFSVGWSSDGKALAYFSEGKLKTVPVDGGPARIVCDARPEGTPSWHGDTILYTQYSAERGILRVNAAGGKPELLIGFDPKDPGLPWWPQFLPDGKHFLYLMIFQHGENAEVNHELRIGSLDGGPPKRVPMTIDSRAVYANGHLLYVRDGTLLAQPFDPDKARSTGEAKPIIDGLYYFRNTGLAAFTVSGNGVLAWRLAGGPSRLVWMDRAGIETGVIASAPFSGDGRLSPDGHRYAVSIVDPKQGVADLWIYDLDRDSSERITFTMLDDKAPVWAPDGRTIYYRSDCCGPPDILRWTPGADAGTTVYRGPGVEEPQDVSSDGKWLLFSDHRQAGAADIHVLPLIPPGPPHPFVKTRFNEYYPRFSPDGRWVAYESNISGKPEIYVKAFDGAGPSTRVSKDGGTRPRWRRDGKELFFLAPGARIMSVAMNGGAATAAPRMLFQAAEAINFEPAHDGSRFIVQLEERTSDPPVHLLINWPARLRDAR